MNNARPYKSERSENLHGTFAVPGDKSISHRTVMFGLLAEGTTTATDLLEGEDVMATAAAATAMGASVRKDDPVNSASLKRSWIWVIAALQPDC